MGLGPKEVPVNARKSFVLFLILVAASVFVFGCPGGGTTPPPNPPPPTPSTTYIGDPEIHISVQGEDRTEMLDGPMVILNPQADQPFGRIGFKGETPDGCSVWPSVKADGKNAAGHWVVANTKIKMVRATNWPIIESDTFPSKGAPVTHVWVRQGDQMVDEGGNTQPIWTSTEINNSGLFKLVTCTAAAGSVYWWVGPIEGWLTELFCLFGTKSDEVPVPLSSGLEMFEIPISAHNLWAVQWDMQYEASITGFKPAAMSVAGSFYFDVDCDGYPNGWEIDNGYDPYDPNDPGTPGPTMVNVPNVVGQLLSAASNDLTAVGLTTGTVTYQNSQTVPAGKVISQNPTAGTSVAIGTAINLVVSLGPIPPGFGATLDTPGNGLICNVGDNVICSSTAFGGSGYYTFKWHFPDNDFKYQEDVVKVFDMPGTGTIYLDVTDVGVTPNVTIQKSVSVTVNP